MKKNLIAAFTVIIAAILAAIFIIGKPFQEKVTKEPRDPNDTHFDVIVFGGEPEGVAAAVSAARNGADVLLVEERDGLGGLMTYGMLNYLDIPENSNRDVTSQGIFMEWWKMVGGKNVSTVDIQEAKDAFAQLVDNEENITLLLDTEVTTVDTENAEIKSATLSNGKTYTAERYIDATADADIAAMSGVSFTTGQEDLGNDGKMAVTLMIHLTDVDWDGVKKAGKSGAFGGAEVTKTAAWGFPDILREYEESEENTRVRGLNIGRTPKNGDVYINALQIFNVDGLNEEEKQKAIEEGKREIDSFVKWLNKNLEGFENAKVKSYPTELYVRETRHINSLYRLKMADVWEGTPKTDAIAYGAYPLDVQAMSKSDFGFVIMMPDQYAIPYRSIVPVEIDNLLVTSKASGYDSLPASSARIIPTGMAVAEAGGLIAQYTIENNLTLKQLVDEPDHMEKIQKLLVKQDAYLKENSSNKYPYKGDENYEDIKKLYTYSLISAGYDNDLKLDDSITPSTLINLYRNSYKKLNIPDAENKINEINALSEKYTDVKETTVADFEAITAVAFGDSSYSYWDDKEKIITRRDAYKVIADFITPYIDENKLNNEE